MSETALLEAVRDQIRQRCEYGETECEIEYDAQAPAIAGDVYVVVMPGGWRDGPANRIGGGVLDEIYDVDVEVVLRSPAKPRDRKRHLFLDALDGINRRIRGIVAAMHFSTEVMGRANTIIIDSTEGFIEMLKFGGVEPRPRSVGSEYFAARQGEVAAGLARRVHFVGARRIQYRSNMK